ncbi:MAG: ATP-dependent Clp protease ATP-binding subunit ClpC [Elusimicrobia bacterium HGW-Elusimicrobia-2]|nr:MAG: ATP-dependent Clp protease ATP-binding subunit ClpC [Elusimicrobia bacterium HGW-Elusimicrobia-2]
MDNRFTKRAQRVLANADRAAKDMNHSYIGSEHVLMGLLMLSDGIAVQILSALGVKAEDMIRDIKNLLGEGDNLIRLGPIPFSPRAKRIINGASVEAKALGQPFVGTEHILLAVLGEASGIAAQVLRSAGVSYEAVMDYLKEAPDTGEIFSPSPEKNTAFSPPVKTPLLNKFSRDLTKAARDGELDPVVGREKEVSRVIQILCRRTKNNPVLIGDPGVGKTAVVEGIAQHIVSESVPEIIHGKRVVSLDMGSIVAGTKYRGEFEDRMRKLLDEIKKEKGQIILFIDELHLVVGSGSAEGAPMDAANMLKPLLARGELQCIGATTLNEYRKYIEKDAALARRFQPVMLDAPTVEETIEILKGLRDKYEAYHGVRYSDEALQAAAQLSDRYITDRFLPDKAIDLVDEAGSEIRIKKSERSPEFMALQKTLKGIRSEKAEAISGQEFEKAAQLKREETRIADELKELKEASKGDKTVTEVTAEDMARIVAGVTGIPVFKLTEKESQRLLNMEKELHKDIVSQDEAISVVSRALRRARTGLHESGRPIGSFIFLGPTGVGKTYLAQCLAKFLFGDEDSVVRVDMSEYMERHSVSRLVGAPPGYVGYDEGGLLTGLVRRKPYSVILLDEIEKAHPDVFNILLQIMDSGFLTDSLGHRVNFKNTVLIMTSNLGVKSAGENRSMGFAEKSGYDFKEMENEIKEELKKYFRPEFLNRIDAAVVFRHLSKEDVLKIVDMLLARLKKRLDEKNISVEFDEKTKEFLAEKGFDKSLGARLLKRTIQDIVEDPLSERILSSGLSIGAKVKAVVKDGKIDFVPISPEKTNTGG